MMRGERLKDILKSFRRRLCLKRFRMPLKHSRLNDSENENLEYLSDISDKILLSAKEISRWKKLAILWSVDNIRNVWNVCSFRYTLL